MQLDKVKSRARREENSDEVGVSLEDIAEAVAATGRAILRKRAQLRSPAEPHEFTCAADDRGVLIPTREKRLCNDLIKGNTALVALASLVGRDGFRDRRDRGHVRGSARGRATVGRQEANEL
jgi:hypothetical protein